MALIKTYPAKDCVNVKLNDGVPRPIYKQSSGENHRQRSFFPKIFGANRFLVSD